MERMPAPSQTVSLLGWRVRMDGLTLTAQCVTRLAARLAGYSAVKVLRNWSELLRTPATLACFVG